MYYYKGEQEAFYEFLYENIGKNISTKTPKHLWYKMENIVFPKKEITRFENLFSKYNTVEYYFEEYKKNSDYISLTYLVQYYHDSSEEKMYRYLFDDIYEIRDSIWDIYDENILNNNKNESYKLYDVDWEKFKTAKKKEKVYYYMIFDSETKGEVEKILNKIYKEELIIKEIDVVNDAFGVDGLCYVELEEEEYLYGYEQKYKMDREKNRKNQKSSQVSSALTRLRIPGFTYVDRRGEVKLRQRYMAILDRDKNSSTTGEWKKDLNRVFMSSWEANIARLFNYKNISWEYESKSYYLKIHRNSTEAYPYSYTPDFHISDKKIVEVKGFWDNNSLEVCTSFEQEYFEYMYHIIDGDMYYTLEKLYSDIIPNWEKTNIKPPVFNEVKLVGITIENRVEFVSKLCVGDEVFLERDKNNIYDKNAIKVLDKNQNLLGYISKQWATILSKKIDLGMKYQAFVKEKNKKVIDLQLKRVNVDEDIVYSISKNE